MNFKIISDGSCDLPKDLVEEKNIHVVPFYVSFDDTNEFKEGVDISVRDFYDRMVDCPNKFPKSSLPSVQDYLDAFVQYAQKDIPIICICITSKFSGSFNAATLAAELLHETYKNAKITVIDSAVNTVLQGLFVLEAARMQENRVSYEDAVEKLNSIKDTGRIIFTIGTIDYLRHGGRIGKLAGFAASALGIKPLILLRNGEIYSAGIARNRNKAKQRVLDFVKEHFDSIHDSFENYIFNIGYGYDIEEAKDFRLALNELLTNNSTTAPTVELRQIGAAIAVHTGPYALGISFIRKYDAPALAAAVVPRMVIATQKL